MLKMVSSMSAVLMLALLTLAGCSSPQVGVKSSMGTVSGYLDALPPQVTEAARQVAKDMELTIDTAEASQLDGRIVAHTARGKSIKITIDRYGDNISAIAIKVGQWGDEALSLQYYNAIQAKLAGRSRSASPPSSEDLNLLK